MTLCERCELFNIQSFSTGYGGQRGYRAREVRANATSCDFCSLLNGALSLNEDDDWVHLELLQSLDGNGFDRMRIFQGDRTWSTTNVRDPNRTAILHLMSDPGSPAAVNGDVAPRKPEFSGHDASIKRWLDACLQHDRCCRTLSETEPLNPYNAPSPSRCINVGDDDNRSVRLEETWGSTSAYITLSHKWTRETAMYITTESNYSRRLENLELELLPCVFREAIQFTRELGIRYLWIDSLCIIQDAEAQQDWLMEAPRMADYYQNALVNLGATMADRLIPLSQTLVQLPYRDIHGSAKGHFYIAPYRTVEQHYHKAHTHGGTQFLKRGWVYQEWLLCRRALCFTPTCIIFACSSAQPFTNLGETLSVDLCSDSVRGLAMNWNMLIDGILGTRSIRTLLDEEALVRRHQTESTGTELIAQRSYNTMSTVLLTLQHKDELAKTKMTTQLWYEIVETYSALTLTYPEKDRILALEGIAAELGKGLRANAHTTKSRLRARARVDTPPIEIVAGIPLHDLHVGLQWEQDEPSPLARLKSFPTWSWASFPEAVTWNRSLRGTPLCRFENAASLTEPEHTPILGLKGRVQTVWTGRTLQKAEIEVLFPSAYRPRGRKDLYCAIWPSDSASTLCGWGSFDCVDVIAAPVGSMITDREVEALYVSVQKWVASGLQLGYWLPWHDAYNVLFIKRVRDNRYERIGIGVLFGKDVDAYLKITQERDIRLA